MTLVRLSSDIVVNPEHVVSVTRDFYDKYILVKDVLGQVHEVGLEYGKSAFETQEIVRKKLAGEA